MSLLPLHRRTVLQTSACGLAFGGLLQSANAASQAASMLPSSPELVSGTLSGWVTVGLHENAVIRFAHIKLGAPPVELGEPMRVSLRGSPGSPVSDQMRRATTAAHQRGREILARSWNVAVEDCVFESQHIRDRQSTRMIGYSVWVDLA
jgi:hypothetical protein